MDTIKYMALMAVSIGSFCSMEAMDQQPTGIVPDHAVTQTDVVKLIRDGHAKAEFLPEEALDLFQLAYDKADLRIWEHGLKDGKLVKVVNLSNESDQKDIHDVEVWKLLLDKLHLFRKRADGALQEKATLLCALTARKLVSAYCGNLSLSPDIEMAWQAHTLEKSLQRTAAEVLATSRDRVEENPEHPGFQQELARKEEKKSKKMEKIVKERKTLLEQLESVEQDLYK